MGQAAKGLLRRGRRVSLVRDAIATLSQQDSERTLAELSALGARLINTDEALERVGTPAIPARNASSQTRA